MTTIGYDHTCNKAHKPTIIRAWSETPDFEVEENADRCKMIIRRKRISLPQRTVTLDTASKM